MNKEEMDAFERENLPQLANLTPEQAALEHQIFHPGMDAFEADEAVNKVATLEVERAQLLADIATAEKNLKVLCYTSEEYSGQLDQPIAALVDGLAAARARVREINKEMK